LLLVAGFFAATTSSAQTASGTPVSPRMAQLIRDVEKGTPNAVQTFWNSLYMNRKEPIVEEVPTHPELRRVTFVVRATEGAAPQLIGPMLPPATHHQLTRVPGTEIWYLTADFLANARFTYAFEAPGGKELIDSLNPPSRDADKSVLELPLAPRSNLTHPVARNPHGRVMPAAIPSRILGQRRKISVYTPPGYPTKGVTYGLLIALDGEDYRTSVPVPTIIDNLLATSRITPLVAVFVDNIDQDTRNKELGCSDSFSDFLAKDVVDYARTTYHVSTDPSNVVASGSSLGGLAAACAAFRHPEAIGKVLSQSGSYWFYPGWPAAPPDSTQTEWFAKQIAATDKKPIQFFLEAGLFETFPPLNLLGSNRTFRAALVAKGYDVAYSEFAGGHEPLNWKNSFGSGLVSLVPSLLSGVNADNPPVALAFAAERKFFDLWGAYWAASERTRNSAYYDLDSATFKRVAPHNCMSTIFRCTPDGPTFIKPVDPRLADFECYVGFDTAQVVVPELAWGVPLGKRMIASQVNSRRFVCPNWLPPGDFYLTGPHLPDERSGIDAALEPKYRAALQRQRLLLIAQFQQALQSDPKNNATIGQLVRLRVDAKDYAGALSAARGCAADRWWCLALRGYVQNLRGDIRESDSLFAASVALMPETERCRYSNIGMLFAGDAQEAYVKAGCAGRDSLNATTWWLADPLWSVPGNDRRTEQFSRRVLIDLHAATGRDERFNWMPGGGGDALAEMIARYGWMSYAYASMAKDTAPRPIRFPAPRPPSWGVQLLYAPQPDGPPLPDPIEQARKVGGWQSTFEYSLGRVHAIPAWSMITDPFGIKTTDWTMNGPGGEGADMMKWWPDEHYVPLHPLISLADQQLAFLRRDTTTLIAYATNLAQTDLDRKLGDTVRAVLIASPHPDVFRWIGDKRVGAHDRLTFLGALPRGPLLVSAEIPWDGEKRGARSRFGAKPPEPLSAMAVGTLAMSDPVLLVVPANVTELPLDADSAITLMRGSTTMSAGTNAIGVYWEAYGFNQRDSVVVTISVQRKSGGSNAVTFSWKEPDRGHPTRVINGAVPVEMRSVIVNIAQLPAGSYTLEVSMTKPGAKPILSSREFVLR